MSLLIVITLFASAMLGGTALFMLKGDNKATISFILSFSGAYLFSITIIHLIPDTYGQGNTDAHTIGLYVLGGFLFQLFLEHFSEGVEHGHMHGHQHQQGPAFPIGILISLCLHAFLEGMPLAKDLQGRLLFGIALHHIPAAFALSGLMAHAGLGKTKIMAYLFVFALMSPLGYLTSHAIHANHIGNLEQYYDKIMAVVIGIFLHISTTILFESSSGNHQHFNKKKLLAVLSGIAIAILGMFF